MERRRRLALTLLRVPTIITILALVLASCSAVGGIGPASCSDIMQGHAVHAAATQTAHAAATHAALRGAAPTSTSAGASVSDPTESAPPPTPTRAWSNAALWPGSRLPAEGDVVEIAHGDVVLLDVDTPALGGLRIAGALVFDEQDLELTSDWIEVHGGLYVGSAQAPFVHSATITLTGAKRSDSGCYGNKYIGLLDGTLELYGDPSAAAWTRLDGTADAGATSIAVDDATGWAAGDAIVIASTDYYAYAGDDGEGYDRQVEERTIAAVNGSVITLDEPLEYMHYGESQTFGAGASMALTNTVLESRAEVALLSRNVVIRGDADTVVEGSDRYRHGGHIMAMGASRIRLDSVELTRMGQAGVLLRYPVHFHLMGDAGNGSFIRNSSLHELFNRCITIHGTNDVLVRGNAAYDTFGHCYFLEDGAELGNVLDGNLGLMIRSPREALALLPSDDAYLGPSVFWLTNPANVVTNNVAASSEGTGFWYALPEHPTGPSYAVFDGETWFNRRTPLGTFSGNMAHSNASDGLHVDNGPTSDTDGLQTTSYTPRTDPADRDSPPVLAVFDGFSAYRHRGSAAWFRGDSTVMRNALLVDNAVGVTFASNASGLEDSLVVGESDNLGTVMPWEESGSDGRSLPQPWNADFPIRGFEFYDGDVWVKRVHFERFEPTALREAGAISFLDFTAFSLSPLNRSEHLSFGHGTNEVYLATRTVADIEPATDGGEDGYRSGVFIDGDGSLTGTAGAYVTMNSDFLAAGTCTYRPAWNANVCDGRYVSLTLQNRDEPARQLAPVTLRRSDQPDSGGAVHTMFGSPHGGPSVPNRYYRSLVPIGFDYHYALAGVAPDEFTIDMYDIELGDTLVVSVPYEGADPFIYRDWWVDDRNVIPKFTSRPAFEGSDLSGYYREGVRLYLRLAQQDDRTWAHLTICRERGC